MPGWDFAANAAVENLEAVPESVRPLYAAEKNADGKHVVAPAFSTFISEHVTTVKNLQGKTTALEAANREAAGRRVTGKAAFELAKEFEFADVDENDPLPGLKNGIAELLKKTQSGGKERADFDALKAANKKALEDMTKAHAGELAKKDQMLHQYLVRSQLSSALAKHKGSERLLGEILAKQCVVKAEGDQLVVRVRGADGNDRWQANGEPFSIEDLVLEAKRDQELASAFQSEQKGGSGAGNNGTQPAQAQRTTQTQQGASEDALSLINSGLKNRSRQ